MRPGLSANLDLLRAIAVLLVLVQHLCKRMYVDRIGWIATSSLGHFGVLLFFVHTSLVLMYSMERSGLTGRALLKNFYIRRIFRIYPLSILTVLVALLLHLDSDVKGVAGLSYGQLPGKTSIIFHFLLAQNVIGAKSIVNVLWSLPFEMQMYLFLPFLFCWTHRKRSAWPLVVLWGACLIPAAAQPHVHALWRLSILCFVPNFLPGVIAFALPRVALIRSYLWPVFIIGLAAVFTLNPVLPMGWILCLILGLCIPYFEEITTPWLLIISERIATYSYGIYLSHQFAIWIALGLFASHPVWVRLPLLIGLFIGFPILLYHVIERPMIRAGVQLATNWHADRRLMSAGAPATA